MSQPAACPRHTDTDTDTDTDTHQRPQYMPCPARRGQRGKSLERGVGGGGEEDAEACAEAVVALGGEHGRHEDAPEDEPHVVDV
eukprot:3120627-Rhodomonas_salina.1